MAYRIFISVDKTGKLRDVELEAGARASVGKTGKIGDEIEKAVKLSLAQRSTINIASNIVSAGTLGAGVDSSAGMLNQAGQARLAAGTKGGPQMLILSEAIKVLKGLYSEMHGRAQRRTIGRIEDIAANFAAAGITIPDAKIQEMYDRRLEQEKRMERARRRVRRRRFLDDPLNADLYSVLVGGSESVGNAIGEAIYGK